ncbi:uncharacterized protein K460DRAFT_370172 [Cucurbitaria berberidis CBS 394.84]|uniref:Zn(2)-C6 fungal-type domain-containing protein n=1 Tax=Cucurbitaria berberidis CBS 394.84 TaxID=1168544 RepID=A0A9P4GB44_9PLEO|nr:uncharacterized protein K460DRAFT_370172 [Cucurbitaria berberidis CBS 394.84]KAF1842187.1 hypothetical protein K460DRAFT_370172 [Cucurbitaria berberidis CBS 394.84]
MSSGGVEKRGSAATVRACDLCRRRKRKCIWSSGTEGCTHCVNLNEKCTTTHIRKQRVKPQRGNRIAEYENRIQRLESLLQERNAAQPQIHWQPLHAADPAVSVSTWVNDLRHEVETMPGPEVPDFDPFDLDANIDLPGISPPDDLAALSIHDATRDDSTLSASVLLSLPDIQPSTEFQDDAAFLQSTAFGPEASVVTEFYLPPPLPAQTGCDWYLPPPEMGTSLLAEFLTDFNAACPLYQPHVIADHLRVCYAGHSDGSVVSWISTYVIFGLAHMLRAMSTTGTPYDTDMARYYLARIYRAMNSLLVSPPSLGLVQCLLGVALLITTTSFGVNMSEGHFVSTALRVVHNLAYQDDETYGSDTVRDVEQERRVFWLAFIYDTNTSILTNSPTTHRQEDVIYCVPELKTTEQLGTVTAAEGSWRVNMFVLRVNLAVLQAEAIDQVLSVTTDNKTPTDIDAAAAVVLSRLQAFHNHDIFQFTADQLFQLLYRSDIVHTISLEASYFATVFRLHAFEAFERNSRLNPFSLDGLSRMAKVKQQKSCAEAKRLLSLLPIASRGDVGMYWQLHRTFLAALVTVLAHHINNPTVEAPTTIEMRGYGHVLTDIGHMVQTSGNVDIAQARDVCMGLYVKLQTGLHVKWMQGMVEGNENIAPAIVHRVGRA